MDAKPCYVEECNEPARFGFMYDWGHEGACCAAHQPLVRQTAGNLQRGVTFTVLDPNYQPPLTRDERTQLRAQILSLTDEVEEVKARAAKLYQANDELRTDLRRTRATKTEAEAQVNDLRGSLDKVMKERDDAHAALHDAQEEARTLRALVPTDKAPAKPKAK